MDQNPTKISKMYFEWLCKKVERRGHDRNTTYFLADLHDISFYSVIPNDENREGDGLQLREIFAEENNFEDDPLSTPCTLLEMLIALADRMNYALYEPERGDRCERWFWLLVNNLGLELYDCDDPLLVVKRNRNNARINKFLDRRYMENGRGGLFPLQDAQRNQREVEIWYQMMEYLEENYPI